MDTREYFKIGELANLFDIGVDSIRYYEEVGILTPQRDPENNYRIYTIEDVRRLTIIRELLELHFSTAQIREFIEKRSVAKTVNLLETEQAAVEKQLLHYQKIHDSITARITRIRQLTASPDIGRIRLQEFPERGCVMITNDNLPDRYVDYYVTKYKHESHRRIDTIGACDCYSLDIAGSNPDSLYFRTRNVFFYTPLLAREECNFFLPAGAYLTLLYRGALSRTKELYPSMLSYAKRHKLTLSGDPMEFCHIDEYETNDDTEYITEVQIRISAGEP